MPDTNQNATGANNLWLRHDESGQLWVHPKSNDIFAISFQKAIDACMNADRVNSVSTRIRDQLNELANRVNDWACEHSNVVRVLFAPRSGDEYLLLIVTRGSERDEELADDISALDLEIHDRFTLFPTTTMSVPENVKAGIVSFVPDPDGVLMIYGPSDNAAVSG